MQQNETIAPLAEELARLVHRAKHARNILPALKAPDCLDAATMAHELAVLGGDFIILATALKQAGRNAANAEAEARRAYRAPPKNAARMAAEMRRRGAYSIAP